MGNKGLFGAVISATIAAGVVRGIKRKKVKEEAGTNAGKLPDAEVISSTSDVHETVRRTCPACGNVDTSGADRCPLCYTNLNPNAPPEDF